MDLSYGSPLALMFGEPQKLPDMCSCSSCNSHFKVKDCDTEHGHHDGWEMPAYTEIYCPRCEDGGSVDDFYFLEDLEKDNAMHEMQHNNEETHW